MQLHYPLNPATGAEDQTQLPWTNGVPQTGQEGSYPPFALCTEPMYEIVNALMQAGIVPSSSDPYQLTRAIRGGQLDFAVATGTPDAIVATIGLAHLALKAGLPFTVTVPGGVANSTTTPTLTITGPGGVSPVTGPIRKTTGANPAIGDLPPNAFLTLRSDGVGFRLLSVVLASDVLALIQSSPAIQSAIGVIGRSQVFTASGTFNPPVGVTQVEVELIGGGGAGGASSNTTAGGGILGNPGGGGAGGGYCYGRINLTSSGGVPVTIGAGGLATANAGGGNGGLSSFSSYCSAGGGFGGPFGSGTIAFGGTGGTATGGLLNLQGGQGGASGTNSTTVTNNNLYVIFARGGQAPRGLGSIDLCNTGGAGTGYGNGGSGASGGSGLAGGSGAPGICIVRW